MRTVFNVFVHYGNWVDWQPYVTLTARDEREEREMRHSAKIHVRKALALGYRDAHLVERRYDS
jgi:hypothetical protein